MNRYPWFRLYTEARTDAKLRTLTDAQFRVWFNLLCYASEQDERGTIPPTDPFLLAVEVASGDEQLLASTVERLVMLRMIAVGDTEDTLTFAKFTERQYDKPSDAPDATRERKARQRAKARDEGRDVSDVTPMSRDVTPSHAPEKKREEENRPEETLTVRQSPSSPAESPHPAPPDGGERVRPVPKPTILTPAQQVRFDRWYKGYPNKQHRPEAERAWKRLDPDDALTARLIADVEQRRGGRKWTETFIELPATYLNQRVYEDDIEPVRIRALSHNHPAVARARKVYD